MFDRSQASDVQPRVVLLLALASTGLLVGGCGRVEGKGQGKGSAGPARPALAVRVANVAVQDVTYEVKALGSLEPQELVQVTAEVEGAVSEVRFNEGDRVSRNTVLARIDPERYRLEAARAEAALRQSEAERGRAEADLQRREALAESQLVAAEELNRSRGETTRLRAAAEAARAQRDWALENLKRSDLRAPAAGVINTRTVETGQYVKLGNILAILVDTSRLRLRFKVSETESLRAKEGGEVFFRVAALGQQSFPARIYHVGEIADPATRQVEVLAWVKNPGELKPGFFAEVTLAVESKKGALTVPEGAVQASERGFIVYAVEDGKAKVRPVEIGLRTGTGVVEILSGVEPGQTVVVEGSDRLGDGVAVATAGGPASAPTPTRSAP
jgi:membrane fusion protein (multidrug efflux system)